MDQDDVGLVPGHTVLDGDPVPTHGKGRSSPQLSKFTGAGFVAGTGSMSVRQEDRGLQNFEWRR